MIQLEIPIRPTPWASPELGRGGHVYDIREPDKRVCRYLLRALYHEPPIPGYVVVEFVFIFRVPFSTSKKKKAQMLAGEIIPTRSDCTNLQKLTEDCIKNILITDDRNVAKISSEKIYGNKEKILINVFSLEEYRNNNAHSSR